MKLTQDEMRVIRKALVDAYGVSILTDRQVRIADKLLAVDFPDIPEASPTVRPDIVQKQTPPAPIFDGSPNTKIQSHNGGYIVLARRRPPYKFYPVEWTDLHSHAKLFSEQLEADNTMRNEAVRDAKGWDFYANKAVVIREREPRENLPPVEFSFDE